MGVTYFNSSTPPRVVGNSYQEATKRIRRKLRNYSLTSIINVSLSILRENAGKRSIDEIQSAPWITLLIAKLAIEDSSIHLTDGKLCSEQVFNELRHELWEVAPDPEKSQGDDSSWALRMIRALAYPQLLFQQKETLSFVRWPALIAQLDEAHPCRVQFINTFGCDPDIFMEISFTAYAAVMKNSFLVDSNYFNHLKSIYGVVVDQFIQRFSKTYGELRNILQEELQARKDLPGGIANIRPVSEINEFPWFSRYPFLRYPNGQLVIWHRLVFARGMEDAVHNSLALHGQSYTDNFSKIFESYVVSLIDSTKLPYISEQEIRQGLPNNPAVEVIIPSPSGNVMVEAKMSLFRDEILITDRESRLFSKLKRVKEAMVQGWRVGDLIRNGYSYTQPLTSAIDYLVIVTSRQLNICSGEQLIRLLGPEVLTRFTDPRKYSVPSARQLQRLPLNNIFIISIAEFENLMGAIEDGLINLQDFLKEASILSSDLRTSTFTFDQMLGPKVKKWRRSKLIEDTTDRIMENLKMAFT
ncbi:GapS1 family protein [Methylovorus mays]|uniref:GapS1 family protein n=1 Tax=Methylovorus mays TaxID=184077 RepID=UPI001E48EAB9|nr:hypothetical protein [Methylovorus mays]MCB5207574.1 hypothetical protein [Methylovorus mays]